MSDRYEREAPIWDAMGYPDVGDRLRALAATISGTEGPLLLPDNLSGLTLRRYDVPTPRLTPEAREWRRQAWLYAEMYAPALGMTHREYVESLPDFEEVPEEYKGRFEQYIVPVHPELGLDTMAQLAHVSGALSDIVDWEGDPQGFATPQQSYIALISRSLNEIDMQGNDIRVNLPADERWANIHDGLALYTAMGSPIHFVDYCLPGSQRRGDERRIPFISDEQLRSSSRNGGWIGTRDTDSHYSPYEDIQPLSAARVILGA